MHITWIPASHGLSDAELDAILTTCPRCPGALPAPIRMWLKTARDEWHRRALHKRFDEER
jgi:hypothetical protein